MHLFAQCGLPLSLDGACKAMGMSEDEGKMKEGKALIRYFCLPCKPTKTNGGRTWNLPEHAPDKWETFKAYCLQDVEAMRTGFYRCLQWMPRPEELRFHTLDARINEKGVRIDRRLAQMAVAMDLKNKEELTAQAIAISGLENPKSVSQIKQWLFDQEGKEFPSLNKKVIADVVANLQTDEAKKFMAIRSELAKSSVAKYDAMLRSMGTDDHVRGCFAFYGANRTGRFAGRLVQFQNLSKNYMDGLDDARELVRDGHYTAVKTLYNGVSDVLSQLVRTAIIPEDGEKILVSDFSAIEARVIAWIAGEDWRLDVFRSGGDIYCASASQMFRVPVVKHGENGHLRQKGKVAELALGYGGGVNALKAFGADKMGMTDEEMQETVDLWRESSPRICALWKSLEKAAIRAVARRGTTTDSLAGIRFDYEQGVLWMTLPSGRRIAYWGAKYEESRFSKNAGRKVLSYMGVNQQTKKWERVETWGGKLTENLVQATARDCLRDAMFALDEAGFDIRAHVHDEVIITEPLDGRSWEDVAEIMGRDLPWAEGLPLSAAGYEGSYYFKD
jgi:DNA polymerase